MTYTVTITRNGTPTRYPTSSSPEQIRARYRAALTPSETMTATPDGFIIRDHRDESTTTTTTYTITLDAPPPR